MEYNLRTRRSAASCELSAPSSLSGLPKETILPSYLSTANAVVVDADHFEIGPGPNEVRQHDRAFVAEIFFIEQFLALIEELARNA